VKFSFERYKGGAANLFKDNVKEIQLLGPGRLPFVLKEPWPANAIPGFYLSPYEDLRLKRP
jgi:hypothetical protein